MENQRNKLWQYLQALPNKASEALLGKPVLDVDSIDLSGVNTTTPEFKENMGGVVDIKVGNNPRVGGLIPDITAGYRENSARPLELNNLQTNITPDGRNKGAAYRFGEFAGTAARLLDNPLVRGGIAYGLSKSMGDRRPLVEGLTAAVGTQQNRMKDKMYRNELEKMGFDTNGITGFIGDDTFNKIFQSKQLQDNAEYRNAILASQQRNQELANKMAQQKFDYAKISDAADRALRREEIDIAREKIQQNNKKNANLGNLQAVSGQLKRFEDSFASMPNKLESNTLGRLRNATGLQTKEEANFNSQRTLLFNKIARDLGGEKGVLSDQDIKRIEKSLPDYTDSMVQKQAKMQAIYDLLNDRLAVEGGSLDNTQTTTGNTTKSGVKYEVID